MESILAFNLCAFILLSVLIFSLFLRKMTQGKTNITFMVTTFVMLICSITTVVGILGPKYLKFNPFTVFFMQLNSFFYYLTRLTSSLFYLLFCISLCGKWYKLEEKKNLILLFSAFGIVLFFCVLNCFYPIFVRLTSDLHFEVTRYIWISYFLGAVFIAFNIFFLIYNRKLLKPLHFGIVISIFPVAIIGIVIQLLFPFSEIEIFSSSFLLLLVSMVVLQPKNILDYSSGAFNIIALEEVIKQNFASKRRMRLIYFKIMNSKSLRFQLGNEKFQRLIQSIVKTVYSYKSIIEFDIFNVENGTFVLVTQDENQEKLDEFLVQLNSFLNTKHNINQIGIEFEFLISVARSPQDFNTYQQVINYALKFDSLIKERNIVSHYVKQANNPFFVIENNLDDIIKKALLENNLQMYYQPIYSVKDNKFTSAEALIRLIDDKYGNIPPSIFIPAAENSGAIHQIGDYIIDSVCKFVSRIDMEKLGLDYVEINLSPAQCEEIELPQKVYNNLRLYKVIPEKINMEITESASIKEKEISETNIKELSKMGIKISLDDYGTGFSNLKRISSLPLDIIKLDKVFVDERRKSSMDIVIRNTIEMIKKLNKKVLIEGVETEEDFVAFVNYGCDYVQGYYFSKPLSESDFVTFIKRKNK